MVEFLPVITSIYEAVSGLDHDGVNERLRTMPAHSEIPSSPNAAEEIARLQAERDRENPSPASDELGQRRILRTSPLTEVPFVCCPST